MPEGAIGEATEPARPRVRAADDRFWAAVLGSGLVLMCAVPAFFLGARRAGLYDHEGRYAEVAREMVLTGDWVTPHLNFVPFLNKPPLLFWLAGTFLLAGADAEGARYVSGTAAVLTVVAVFGLAWHLGGRRVAICAAAVLLAMPGFALEGRVLRPDMLLTAAVSVAVWCLLRSLDAGPRNAAAWHLVAYGAMGLAVLAKGLLGIVLPVLVVGPWVLATRGRGGLRMLRPVRGAVIVAAIAAPWHVLAAVRNPGFLWDYLVAQHLLRFFDVKEPRDAVALPLGIFWLGFLARALPWIAFVPVAVCGALRRPTAAPAATCGAVWALSVMAFFSVSAMRLEHYVIPALPGVALLVGWWWAEVLGRRRSRSTQAILLCLVVVFGSGVWWAPVGIARSPLPGAGELERLAVQLFGSLTLAVAGAALLAAGGRRWVAAFALLVLAMQPVPALTSRALVIVAPRFSWQPLAQELRPQLQPGDTVVFEAPTEYQICGALLFLLDRGRSPLLVLRPADFVAPTYLEPYEERLFIDRARLEALWWSGRGRVILVTDPERGRSRWDGVAPGPACLLVRQGSRAALGNGPARGEPCPTQADRGRAHEPLEPLPPLG